MAKIIKNVTVTWTWSGDTYALKGFNLMVLPSGQNPTDGTIQVLASANQVPAESRSYSFNNMTLDTAVTYVPWVQAFYEDDDSDWISAGNVTVTDDGVSTLTTKSEVKTLATTIVNNTKTSGLGIKVNYSTFSTSNPGEIYVHGFDTAGIAADVNGWITWNGSTVSIPKVMLNPNAIVPASTVAYFVWSTLSSAMHLVWFSTSEKKWKYTFADATIVNGDYTWSDGHAVLGQFVMTSAEVISSATLYPSPKHYSEITTAVAAQTTADAAQSTLGDMASDSKLTPLEKQEALKEWNIIVGEYTGILGEGTRFGITTTTYTNAYNTLNGYVPGLVSNLTTTSDITGSTFRDNFKAYYDARQVLLNAINAKAKELADAAQTTATNIQVGGKNIFYTSGNFKSPITNWANNGGGMTLDTTNTWNGWNTIQTTVGTGISGNWYKLENNVEYTYSAVLKSTGSFVSASSMPLHFHAGLANTNQGKIQVISHNVGYATEDIGKYKLLHIVFKLTGDADSFRPFIYVGSGTNVFNIAYIKLEKGNKPTDWAPAPEDVAAQIETKSRTFTSQPSNYAVGDIWKENATIKIAITAGITFNAAHWTLVGDVTSANTAADTTLVGGTAAASIVSGASAGTTANSTVTANKSTWDRASSFDASGNLATTKLTGTVSDTQIASANAWNNAKTLVNDITTDGTLTPFEKQTLKPEYDAILKEKIEAVTLATNYGVTGQSYYTNYIAAYDTLYANMNTMMTTGIASNSTITRSTMNGWFTNYYEKAAIFQRNINEAARTIASGAATSAATANELAKAMTSGKLLYKDPIFSLGTNDVHLYNNSANGNVVHTRITKPTDAPTNSTHLIEIKNIGTASPGIGGFYQGLAGRANAKFVIRYIAKIPVGYTLATASNAMGTGYTDSFLTAIAGTGRYEEYIRVVQCGPDGEFATGGHVYLNGAVGSAGTPVVWYLARIDAYDVTSYESFASHINDDPDTQRIEGKKMHFTNEVLMDNAWIDNLVANSIVATKIQATELNAGKITAGTLSADRIAADSLSGNKITANTIDATRLKIGSGSQGGYINNPRFSAWAGTYPDGTQLWSAGGISKVTVDNVFMAQFAPAAGVQQGMQLNSTYFANGIDLDGMQYFTLECRFRLTSGTNPSGACLLVDIGRQDNSSERLQLNMIEAGSTLTVNTWYVARKVFKLADANVAKTFKNVSGFLLANWNGSGDAAKTIQFASVNMFQASAQEYLAQSWTNGGSTVINGGMIATGTINAEKIYLGAGTVAPGNLNAGKSITGTTTSTTPTDGAKAVGSAFHTFGTGTGNATSGAESAYMAIDLGAAYRIAQSKVYWYSEDTRVYFYKIKYSLDNTTWHYAVGNADANGWMVSAKNISGGNPSIHPTVDTFSIPISARYIRIYANGNTVNTSNHVYEWEMFSAAETIIHGDMIQTGTINASKITTGSLSADRISAGTITAGNGVSTINMNTGEFSFGGGKIALSGSTLSLNVDSLKITNSSVATQTYASGAAATAKSEAITAAASDATSKADGALSSAQTYSDKVAHVQAINGTTKRFTDLGGLSVDSGNITGYIIIQTPITSSYMSRVHISGYNYVGGQSNIDLYVSFYAYSNNSFLNYDFVSTGSFPIKDVVLARNGSNVVIIIGTGTTVYSYPRIVVDEAILGFSTPPDSYVSGWSASIASTYSAGYTNVTTLAGKDTFSMISAVASDISDLESATTALQTFTNTSFADGIIQRAEAQAIAEHLNSLTKENADVINQYNSVYPNALLEGTAKTNLSSAKTGYDTAYSNLVTSINTAISDNITSSAEKADVDAKFGLYGTAIKALTKALSEALVAISAKQAANAQAAAASDATSKVNSVEVGGRNLWIQSDAIAGYTVVGGGTITASTTNHQSMETLTPILAGKKLIYQVWNPSKVTSGNSNRICYFNSSGTYISQVTVPTLNGTDYQMAEFIAPANTASARLAVIQGATAFDSSVKIKFEIGTKATGWTPAPEDVEIQIEAKADNQDVSGNLNTVSTAAAAAQAAADAKLDASAYNDFLVEYASFKDAQAAQSSTASASLEAAKSSLASITNEMGSMKESWVFNNGTKIDATGSGMLLSDEAGGMNLLLSNNRISFFDSGVEVAYIADKTLKINHGIFVKSAQIGAHAISQSPSNPDITIVTWVGI